MINKGLFSTFFIERIRDKVSLDDLAKGRMATLTQTWKTCDRTHTDAFWNTFLKQALSYLQFVPANTPLSPEVYKLYEDWEFSNCISIVYLIEPGADIDDIAIGRFWPAKLLLWLKEFDLDWGILTDGSRWRLYSTKSSRPYEDYVELDLVRSLEQSDEQEYGLFEIFFHKDSFILKIEDKPKQKAEIESASTLLRCQLDQYRKDSEEVLDEYVKKPLLYQIDEALQYLCNGFIFDTPREEEYTEEERKDIFESSVKLLYRCLFLFYAEARRLLPSETEKAEAYERHSLEALCNEAPKFHWGKRTDTEEYDLWMQFKGLINAVNEGDPEYGIMGYNGGLFDDTKERFLGEHRLRNDFFARALYLLSYVEPQDRDPDKEYRIPYEDLEVRHLGEIYENILEYTVLLADTDRIRRRMKKSVEVILVSETTKQKGDTLIQKGDVYFGESALERKQTGSYYTPEQIVQFLNNKAVIEPLRGKFDEEYRARFGQFLEQVNSDYDDVTKRGAYRSAMALIKRFVDEVILEFKVCDPAMGSGHFLVDTANQMSGLVIELLAELPKFDVTINDITSNPNYWRRLITRHCLYGVDLNPLAVDLAKLSLWLNCFAIDHKLTFLDHHLRCGNSLIGVYSLEQLKSVPARKNKLDKKSKQKILPNFDNLLEIFLKCSTTNKEIETFDEDNLEFQRESFEKQKQISERNLSPLADLITVFLMNNDKKEEEFIDSFKYLSDGNKGTKDQNFHYQEILNSIKNYKESHQFFNWPLEFPDVFTKDGKGGFNAAIGNPPWDIVKPKSQEFFLKYDPEFRKYNKQEAIKQAEKLMERNPIIGKKWNSYNEFFKEQISFFREPSTYKAQGKGDINTYKLFLERFYSLLDDEGRIGIVVPSGLYTDQGCQPLRELFFGMSQIESMYCFENRWPTVFNGVDGRFKFVLFSTTKGKNTNAFNCAFMEHNPDRLIAIDVNPLRISLNDIKKFSPDTLSVMEFKSQKDIDVTSNIYDNWLLLGDKNRSNPMKLSYEYHMSNDSHLFNNTISLIKSNAVRFSRNYWIEGKPESELKSIQHNIEISGLLELSKKEGFLIFFPMYEGKQVWFYDSNFEEQQYWISYNEAVTEGKKLTKSDGVFSFERPRWGFRKIAAGTNERTLVTSLLPPYVFHGENIICNENNQNSASALLELACMSSFVLDFVLRNKVSATINIFPVLQLPMPEPDDMNNIHDALIARSIRLICVSEEFSSLWEKLYSDRFSIADFWYSESAPIDSYGPVHEREIRSRLRHEAKKLTPDWGPHCGVYDRLTDRRDTGDRAQLRAEIDAYVALLYNLSRDDFSYILDTFFVLKRKEEAAFGEYMSKRKCLEEYDRIASIL